MTDSTLDVPGVTVDAETLIALRRHATSGPDDWQGSSALPGGFAIRRRGNGQVVAESRAYMPGDDLRHLDRGATARTGRLHTRTFHEERDRVSFLVADFRPSMLWGMRRAFRSVAAAEVLAHVGWQAVEAGGRVGLMAITAKSALIVPTRGRVAGMLAVIGGLVKAHTQALSEAQDDLEEPALDRALAGLERVVPRGASVIIATALDAKGADFDAVMGRLAQHRMPQFLLVGDRALETLPSGLYPLRQSGGGRKRAIFRGHGPAGADATAALRDYPVTHVDADDTTMREASA